MNREVQAEGSWVVATVQQALGEMIDPAKVEIYAHPQEIPLLTSHRHELQAQLNASSELQFVPDSNIEKGGCIVRTKHGAVDARIDTQVNEVKRALLDLAVNL
jgi:flagellar assembly protein FliH